MDISCLGCKWAEPLPNFPLCHHPKSRWGFQTFNSPVVLNVPGVQKEMRKGELCGPQAKLKEVE